MSALETESAVGMLSAATLKVALNAPVSRASQETDAPVLLQVHMYDCQIQFLH